MTARLSTALVTKMMDTGSFKDVFANCAIDVYSGTQPADADAASTGTLLVTLSKSSGAITAETKAVGSLTIAGSAGSVDSVTVNAIDILGGSVAYATDINATATAVAAKINDNPKNLLFVASTTGTTGVITITAVNGLGTLPNGWAVSGTYTTITGGTYVAMTGGVDAVNGLRFGNAIAGVLSKAALETWSGTAVAGGVNAGWFRVRSAGEAGTAADTTFIHPRYDGAISTSGAQMNLGSLLITIGAPFILSGATFTLPKV